MNTPLNWQHVTNLADEARDTSNQGYKLDTSLPLQLHALTLALIGIGRELAIIREVYEESRA